MGHCEKHGEQEFIVIHEGKSYCSVCAEEASKQVTVFSCGPSSETCKCECATGGPCEHQWDGPWEEIQGENGVTGGTATCSKCGLRAIDHDLWVAP